MATIPEVFDYIPVAEFYHDSSVFITGGTGFLGKVLVEKLLWSCPGIKNIYLLMRPKRGKDVSTRLAELVSSPIFSRLSNARPGDVSKIVPINGDVSEPELGITKPDQKILTENVSVVFHAAATIKFNEALKLAITINMMGTKQLVELCRRMLKLKALVHVSTAYSNCDREEVEEIIYPPPYDPEDIVRCMKWMDDKLMEGITPLLIGEHPNTYTFTKALAESMLLRERGDLPVAIVRPSIVLSTWHEPVPGWGDSWTGPTGLVSAGMMGLFRTKYCHGNKVVDLIPADMVVNLMICVAWQTARKQPDNVVVYNCGTGQQNPFIWANFLNLCSHFIQEHPAADAVWYPELRCSSSRALNLLYVFTFPFCYAYVMDIFCQLSGRKSKFVEIQSKLRTTCTPFEFFTTRQWDFKDENVRYLLKILSTEDRCTFHFDAQDISWPVMIENYVLGIRKYLLNQEPSSLPTAKRRMKKLLWIHRSTQTVGVILFVRLLFMVFSYILAF